MSSAPKKIIKKPKKKGYAAKSKSNVKKKVEKEKGGNIGMIDFKTTKKKVFVVLPDGDKPEVDYWTVRIDLGDDEEFLFSAIVYDKMPEGGPGKILNNIVERVQVVKEMQKAGFKKYCWVDEEGKLKNLEFNNDASAMTMVTFVDPLVGRVVFEKK